MKIRTAAQFAAAHNAWLESPDDDPQALAIEEESSDVAAELEEHVDALFAAIDKAKERASLRMRQDLNGAYAELDCAWCRLTASIAEARLKSAVAGRDGL